MFIKISLTPSKYLTSEGKYIRAKLVNDELKKSETKLEVLHDIENDNDPLALEVYCNDISIGFIQKYSNDYNVDDYCFNQSGKKRKLKLLWKNGEFLLSRDGSIELEDIGWVIKLWEWADNNEIKNEFLPRYEKDLLRLKELEIEGYKIRWLPKEIGCLKLLNKLTVDFTSIEEIPLELSLLDNLKELSITRTQSHKAYGVLNQFLDVIIDMPDLISLDLHENDITEIPLSVDNLINLRKLNISNNMIEELPKEIGNLINLTHLSVGDNDLFEIPAEIGNLENLSELNIYRTDPLNHQKYENELEVIPDTLGNLKNLKVLWLSGHRLDIFPYWITKLHKLEKLYLHQNQFTEIPKEISDLENLVELCLMYNRLSEIPEELGKLSNLKILRIDGNHKIETLPNDLLNISGLTIRGLKKL